MKVVFTEDAFAEYMTWQTEDRKTLKRINLLIKEIQRNGLGVGIGKPERLKGYKYDVYSRHIDDKNRLVYTGSNDLIEIISCTGHYDDD